MPPHATGDVQSYVTSEIWASGLRNPWKISLDVPTNRLFIGDVGEVTWEEVNLPVSYTHLRAHETVLDLVCRLLLE